jgi:hypothetical protein
MNEIGTAIWIFFIVKNKKIFLFPSFLILLHHVLITLIFTSFAYGYQNYIQVWNAITIKFLRQFPSCFVAGKLLWLLV